MKLRANSNIFGVGESNFEEVILIKMNFLY